MDIRTVTLPYNNWDPLTWAKENCPSYITNNAIVVEETIEIKGASTMKMLLPNKKYFVEYYFYTKEDAALFAMRWL